MMFPVMLGVLTVAILGLVGGVVYRVFWARGSLTIPPLRNKDTGPRETFSRILSVVGVLGLFSGVTSGFYRRNHDLYQAEVRLVAVAMAIGLLAVLTNRYFYGRWI